MAFRHLLVPVDFGAPSTHAIDLALETAARLDARVTLLHVAWMPPYYTMAYAEGLAYPVEEIETEAKAMLDDVLAKAKAKYPRTEGMMITGIPWEQILEAARMRGADLIVMGTHGRRGVSRLFLGSVTEKVVRHAPIPVLTTPGAPVS